MHSAASSISTFATVAGSSCRLRSLMNVSVSADSSTIGPLSIMAMSSVCASRSPVTPLPASFASRRQNVLPPSGASALMVQSCR